MISSRRLAREWALRILYQIDIGKTAPSEALAFSLETLRKDFVQRGSRTASGSPWEALCLEYLTLRVQPRLAECSAPFIAAFTSGLQRLFSDAPYWQELRFERALRLKFPSITLTPPMHCSQLSSATLFPEKPADDDLLSLRLHRLTPEETRLYRHLLAEIRTNLPLHLDPEMKRLAKEAVKEISENAPTSFQFAAQLVHLTQAREAFCKRNQEIWEKSSAIIGKQLQGWLKTARFAIELTEGALANVERIDQAITEVTTGWKLERLVAVDRNVLRIACFELICLPNMAQGVSINEAVELAKKYSSAESGGFVNGVLGAVATLIQKEVAADPETEEEALDMPDITGLEEDEE